MAELQALKALPDVLQIEFHPWQGWACGGVGFGVWDAGRFGDVGASVEGRLEDFEAPTQLPTPDPKTLSCRSQAKLLSGL